MLIKENCARAFSAISLHAFTPIMGPVQVFLSALLLAAGPGKIIAQGVDLTIQEGTSGGTVVAAALARIRQTEIFSNDNNIVRRIAYVETRDGTDTETYRAGYHGGIWAVDETLFQRTQSVASYPSLTSLFSQINTALRIDWSSVQWSELRKPLYSALAARIYLYTITETIPIAIASQAQYWQRNYNPSGSVPAFVTAVNELNAANECSASGIDLYFVLDSSGSVRRRNFELMKDFVYDVTNEFDIGFDATQVGVISYDSTARFHFFLDTYNSKSPLLSAVNSITYRGGGTNTAAALDLLRTNGYTPSNGARPASQAIPRVAVVVTDGRSNDFDATIIAARNAHAEGLTLFAVGVGNNINMVELEAIASDPAYVSHLTGFDRSQFNALQMSISSEVCTVIVEIEIATPVSDTIGNGEKKYFQYHFPDQGLTLKVYASRGSVIVYASDLVTTPNEVLYDRRIETDGYADVFIDPGDLGRPAGDSMYVSIEGREPTNSFIIDTTSGNRACTPVCQNGECRFPGICVCDAGWTGPACDALISCPTIDAGDHGTIECIPPSQRVGSTCTFSCDDGYNLSGTRSLLCQTSGSWTNDVPTCEPRLCEPLTPPENGNIVLPCSREFTTSCTIRCMGGYRVSGLAQQRCVLDPVSGDVVWTDPPVCEDVNECELGLQNCTNGAECVNTDGGFRCSCDDLSGFKLNEIDYASCEDINECETRTHNCSDRGDAPAQCINTVGGFVCSCDIGFRFNTVDSTCRDIDECREGVSGCNQECNNSIGSFTCSCFSGFVLNENNLRICEDINECLVNNGGCESPASCVNFPGGHECECPRGYSLDRSDMQRCEALNCPQLSAPLNGSINCNPSNQRVGALCTFMCDQGYDLTGSQTRTCRSSVTWSGQPATCEPRRCTQLQPPDDGLVLFPCTGAYSTSCSIECREGYRINGTTTFQQMCILDPVGQLRWTDPPVCVESNICEPNLCRHGGICSPFDTSSFSCDCEGTGYTGPTCDTAIVFVAPIPNLMQNVQSDPIAISVNVEEELVIKFDGGPFVVTSPTEVVIFPPSTSANFTVTATQPGVFSIRYDLLSFGANNFLQPQPSTFFVSEVGDRPSRNYFNVLNLPVGQLREGCCTLERHSFASCPESSLSNRVTLRAGCLWDSSGQSYTTSGLVFAGNQNFSLPLSITGVSVDGNFVTSLPLHSSCTSCIDNHECDANGGQPTDPSSCYCYRFTNQDTLDFLQTHSLASTYLQRLQPLLPSWMEMLEVDEDQPAESYAAFEYATDLVRPVKIPELRGCEAITATEEGLYSVLRYGRSVSAIVDSQQLAYDAQTSTETNSENPLCIAVNLCKRRDSPLFIDLSLPTHDIVVSDFLRDYTDRGWDITIHSITLSKIGISKVLDSGSMYWNSIANFRPQLPPFDLIMDTTSLALFQRGQLTVQLNFRGLAYYLYQERDGVLEGAVEMNVASRIAGDDHNFLLMNDSDPTVVDIHGQEQPVPSGAALKLQFERQQFLSGLFSLTEETNACPADVFLHLNESIQLQCLSLRTGCPHLNLGTLTFQQMEHRLYFSGNDYSQSCLGNHNINIPDQASLVILSTLQGQRLPLGRFFTLLPDTEPDSIALSVIYLREDPTPVARLHKVRVSLLESSFTTSIEISNNNLCFMAESEIRGLYPADLTVSAPVNETTWDRLPLSVSGILLDGQNSFIQQLQGAIDGNLQLVADNTVGRINTLNSTRQSSRAQFLMLENQFIRSRLEVTEANRTYQEELAQVDAANVNLVQAQEALANASTDLRNLQQNTGMVCEEQDCEDTCSDSNMICRTCYVTTLITQTGRCPYTAIETIVARVEPFHEEKIVNRWIRPCRQIQQSSCSTSTCQNGRTTVCSDGRCAPVSERVPVYNYRNISVQVQGVRNCNMTVRSSTLPRMCCVQACPVRRPSSACIEANSACRQARQMAYQSRQDLADPLQTVDDARLQLSLARADASRTKILLDAAQQRLDQIVPVYETAKEANDIVESNYQMALVDLEPELQLLQLFTMFGEELLTIINATFDVTVVGESPVQIPVVITYTTMHDGRIYQTKMDVDFSASQLFRRIAADIVEYTFFNASRNSKRSVNLLNRLKRQVAEQDENRLRFEENCADLQNVDSFLNEIADSLFEVNDSLANAQQTLTDVSEANPNEIDSEVFSAINLTVLETVFNVTISMEELQDEVRSNEVNMAYAVVESEYRRQAAMTLEASDSTTFVDWKARLDIVYNQSYSVAEFPCFSFSDCLFTAVSVLERLVSATPGAAARRLELMIPSARDKLLQLGTSMNLTVPEAAEKIRPILNILDEYNQINFWCSSPPEITLQPPTEVNVSANGTLSLTCEAESDLLITYQWRKDGGTIPGANSSHLIISNMQRLDSGNYSCHVSNAVGTVPSINTSVLVYELPQFYLTLVPTSVYEGDDNGAWFACNATALPLPGWRWYFRPSEGSQFTAIDGEDTNELLIPNPQKENEGWYTCEAFNGHGSIRDDPVFLRVLPVTVSQQAIPVQFQIFSDSPRVNECDDMFLQIGVLSAIEELIDTENNFVNDIEVKEMSTTTYAVSFFLTSINVTEEDTHTISFTEIANRAVPTRVALQESREAIKSAIQQGEFVVECETAIFNVIPNSLAFQQLMYICPPGLQLISNYLFCVGCEPGSYSDVTEQTRVFSGEALTERVPVCRPCPTGTYEPRVGSSQCMSCPEFYTTASTGATSADECTVDPLLMECSASGTSERVVISCRTNRPPITTLCSFDGGLEHACELPISVTLLVFGGGNHSVRITAMDSIGFRAERNVHYFLQNDSRTNFFPEVPPLAIRLINDSPLVTGSTVKVDFVLTRPATSVTCQIRRNEQQDCSSGTVTFTDLDPGVYSLRIAASNSRVDRAFLRRRFEITSDPSLCILHLINDGVTVEDDRATVEFAGTGPAESFTCDLDNSPSFTCTTPVVLSGLQAGDHSLRIIPSGCGRNRRPLRVDLQV